MAGQGRISLVTGISPDATPVRTMPVRVLPARRGDRAPFEIHAVLRICRCHAPAQHHGSYRVSRDAIRAARGYAAVQTAFYHSQSPWLFWEVIDIRDGTVIWRSDKDNEEQHNGT